MKANIMYFLTATGVLNSLFLALFLLKRRSRNPLSNKLLAVLLFIFAVKIGYATLEQQLWPWAFAYTLYSKISVTAYLCMVPAFSFYIRSVMNKEYRPAWREYLFFIPAFIYVANPFEYFFWSHHGFFLLQTVFMGFGVFTSVKLFRLWKDYKNTRIAVNRKILNLLVIVQVGMLLVWFTAIGEFVYELTAFYTLTIYFLIKMVMGDFKTINNGWQNHPVEAVAKTDLIIRLKNLMTTEKVFLDSSLTLPVLANRLSVSLHVLSHEINTFYNQNFTEYINTFRIIEACKMLSSDLYDNYTIEGIAYDCGFNSLSSFNSFFKRQMKCTPSQYRFEKRKSLSVSLN